MVSRLALMIINKFMDISSLFALFCFFLHSSSSFLVLLIGFLDSSSLTVSLNSSATFRTFNENAPKDYLTHAVHNIQLTLILTVKIAFLIYVFICSIQTIN